MNRFWVFPSSKLIPVWMTTFPGRSRSRSRGRLREPQFRGSSSEAHREDLLDHPWGSYPLSSNFAVWMLANDGKGRSMDWTVTTSLFNCIEEEKPSRSGRAPRSPHDVNDQRQRSSSQLDPLADDDDHLSVTFSRIEVSE